MNNRTEFNIHDLDKHKGIDCTMAILRLAPELGFDLIHGNGTLFIQILCLSLTLFYDNNMLFYDYQKCNTVNIAIHFSKIWGLWINKQCKNLFGISLGYIGIYVSYGKEFVIRKKEVV